MSQIKGDEAKAMQRAADEARKDERRKIVNYLYAVNARDLAKEIGDGKHDDESQIDPT